MPRLANPVLKSKIAECRESAKRAELSDTEAGLVVSITKTGCATFFARYRHDGRQHRYKLGNYPTLTIEKARTECRAVMVRVARGENPATERHSKRAASTFGDAAARFLREHGPKLKPRTRDGYEALLNKHVLPALRTTKIHALERNDVAKMHSKIGRTSPGAANRALALVSVICSHSERWGWRAENSNPCRYIEHFKEKGAGHYLDATELAALHHALDGAASAPKGKNDVYVAPGAVAALRLLLHSGMRLSEVTGLQWRMVDLERRRLHLPDSKTGAKSVPLTPSAVRLLEQLHSARDRAVPWVCPNEEGGPLQNIQRAWRSIRKRAGLEHVRIHDLRHSFASVALEAGAPLELVGRVLGHRNVTTTRRYAHFADAAVEATAERFSEHLEAKLIAGQAQLEQEREKVVPLARKRAR